MAETYKISTTIGFLVNLNNNRVFFPSNDINIFPCSRRGQVQGDGAVAQYDPEARLNTERTNRLHTAINGFKDSFIINTGFEIGETLKFVLAGYYIEAKSFDPAKILDAFAEAGINTNEVDKIYAHLSLHGGISLSTRDYYTEILYRQSDSAFDKNYLDVSYGDNDFFVGVSFTADKDARDTGVTPYVLPLFSKSDNSWKLVQTSLLPKIEHDTEPDSIKLSGDFTVKHGEQVSFKVTQDETVLGPTVMSSLIVGEKAEGDTFANGTIKVKEHIETPTLEATTSIKTPLLNVDTIASSSGEEIKVTSAIALDSTLKVDGEATLNSGLKVTNGDTSLKKLSAKETNLESLSIAGEAADGSILTVNGKTTVNNDLEVTGTTSAPTLKVDTVTSNSEEIIVDKTLKVDTIASTKDLTVLPNAKLAKNLEVEGTTTLKGLATLNKGLTVSSGDTLLKKTQVEGLTDTGATSLKNLSVSDNATVTGSITSYSLKTGAAEAASLKVTGQSDLKNVSAKKIVANELWLEDTEKTTIGQVPALELAHLTKTNTYQVRFKFGTPIKIIEE